MATIEQDALVEHGVKAAVRAGLFRDEEEAMREAISTWFAVKPELRMEVAIELVKEETVTLDRAAEIAGLNRWKFQDILIQRGIKLEIEADQVEDLKTAAAAIKQRAQ